MAALTGRGGGGEGGEAGRQPPPAGQRIGPTGAGGRAVLEVMLHEGTRALAVARGIRDTSAEGKRCHSRRFAALAGAAVQDRAPARTRGCNPLSGRDGTWPASAPFQHAVRFV